MKKTSAYCSSWKDVLAQKHPDELSSAERVAFDRHLVSCPDCSFVLAEEQEMLSLLHNALLPKKPLPSWDELVRIYTDSHTLSLSQRRIRTTTSFMTRNFAIDEVQSTFILKEDMSQFIDGWPPLLQSAKGRNLSPRGKRGTLAQ